MAQWQKWEYLSVFVEAESEPVMDYLQEIKTWKNGVPRNTPESMIPRLDAYGQEGWELVHMEPVARVGNKGDVLFTGGSDQWSNTYFCVFKRRKPVG
mgnify:CR=1 FL=1